MKNGCGSWNGWTNKPVNPLNPELNPICYLLALLAHHFLHVRRIMVKSLTLRLLMSYIYIWIFVCCECRVLSGRGLCDELITYPEESYRLCCVVICDLETSRIGAPYIYIYIYVYIYIYIYDISNLSVKCVVRGTVSLGYLWSLLGSAEAPYNEFMCFLKDEVACVPFPEKKRCWADACVSSACLARVVRQLAARLHPLCLLFCTWTNSLFHNLRTQL